MTVEVGILNKHGVALAADSAVTIGNGDKFYNTANKLFTLSKFNPVGIMIYSNAEMMGYPIEILIKEYRKKLKEKSFNSLNEYWVDFLEYLLSVFGGQDNEEFYIENVEAFLENVDYLIKQRVDNLVNSLENAPKEVIQDEVVETINNVIDYCYRDYSALEDDEEFIGLEEIIISKCHDTIKDLIEEKIGKLEDSNTEKLIQVCIMILTKKHDKGNRTGIVITGYGENELYPSLINGEFLGIFFGKIKYIIKNEVEITNQMNASIIPFAQVDVINTFMTGIDSDMFSEIMYTIDECKTEIEQSEVSNCNVSVCMDNLKTNLKEKINYISSEQHWGPMVNTVSVAPKEELAQMAETLVNLTSFRRKLIMDNYSQSVGGPIDVAIITKGDGFIWIKRKHYFDKEFNYNFFEKYYK